MFDYQDREQAQQKDVWERMAFHVDEFHEKKQKIDNPTNFEQVVQVDQKTGQPFFKPIISKTKALEGKNSIRDELDPKHINEYLYRHGQIMQMKK